MALEDGLQECQHWNQEMHHVTPQSLIRVLHHNCPSKRDHLIELFAARQQIMVVLRTAQTLEEVQSIPPIIARCIPLREIEMHPYPVPRY